ncbi:hypothetical protein Q7F20_14015 [Curtobacterium sp. A7_M15]|uniref:hypothetical protein n=1 Tax=Curtobacterium sp. A7_M15 TaxID=3065241 RepID=UPI002737D5FC|nr:hypothetical protein [Curtobacterium sp. A7_M15]MDP4334492.1 hypothetical protein [Curtobacterium sp. A7_M15]
MPQGPTPVLEPVVVPSSVATTTETAVCVCGHVQDAHEHYRPGSDCALCDCPRYRRRR